jgi:uncharacterized protein YwqG
MAGIDDLTGLSAAQLVEAYVEAIQAREATEHVGAQNRLFDRRAKIAAELKARDDKLQSLRSLLNHPDPEVRSSVQREFDRLDRPVPEPPPRSPLGPEEQWQCDNPPPSAMDRAEIERLLRGALPDFADRLIGLARPAIGLWPQRARDGQSGSVSRLGGMPLAPPGWQWPIVDAEPLLFVGQIDCAKLRGLPGAEQLPSSGLLAFFGDHDGVMACRMEASDIAIHHWPDIDRLVPAAPPIEPALVFPACALAFRPLIDLPDPFSRVVEGLLQDERQLSEYAAVRRAVRRHGIPDELAYYCSFSKLLGWPALVQQYDLDTLRDEGRSLLLQVDDYSNGEELHGWGPGGSLYFVIRDKDLRMRRFDRCEFEIQFT